MTAFAGAAAEGLLELDLVLARFVERELPLLSGEEKEIFKGLLELSDNDLWDLIAGRNEPGPGLRGRIVGLLRGP